LASLHQAIEIEFVRVTLPGNFAHDVFVVIISKEINSSLFEFFLKFTPKNVP
jgi:hypothetical protein